MSISEKKIALSLWSKRARRPNGGPSSKLPPTQLYIDVRPRPFQMDLVDNHLHAPMLKASPTSLLQLILMLVSPQNSHPS